MTRYKADFALCTEPSIRCGGERLGRPSSAVAQVSWGVSNDDPNQPPYRHILMTASRPTRPRDRAAGDVSLGSTSAV
jgi:hypothetical protein